MALQDTYSAAGRGTLQTFADQTDDGMAYKTGREKQTLGEAFVGAAICTGFPAMCSGIFGAPEMITAGFAAIGAAIYGLSVLAGPPENSPPEQEAPRRQAVRPVAADGARSPGIS